MIRLLELREAKHITQKKLAELSNVPQQTISAIESGKRKNPGIVALQKLAKALGCTLDEMMDEDEPSSAAENKEELL